VGVFEEPQLDSVQGKIEAGDIFVLCSDGLTGHVEDQEILAMTSGRPPQAACEALVQLTLDRGAKDNVTVIVVSCRPAAEDAPAAPPAAGTA
jgi:serine/threonine protein phosphatase PrpC